ncbi:MAG: alpha/beta hydrolase [Actinomycetota bacterium]|nr:alpha/beta hydrolase [Actinomycetota bacterium]
MNETTGTFATRDGLSLHTRTWTPDGEPQRALLIVHGLGEHCGRWDHVARFFADRGYAVAAFDLRGHGDSEGTRAYVGSFGDFVDDVQGLVESGLVRTDLPWVLYGHSLGGLICAYYLAEDRPHPDATVLSAPALEADVPGALRVAAQLLGRVTPKLAMANPFTGEQLSRDEAVGEAYFADPLVYTKSTTRLGMETFAAQDRSHDVIGNIDTPTLVIHGGDDPIVPPSASAPLAAVDSVERKVYPGLRHEMHNEPEQVQVLSEIAAWLDATLA